MFLLPLDFHFSMAKYDLANPHQGFRARKMLAINHPRGLFAINKHPGAALRAKTAGGYRAAYGKWLA